MQESKLPLYNFNCAFGWGSQKTLCHWEHDNQVDLKWAILTSKTGPIQDHTVGDGNFLYSQADESQKGKVARLLSPVIYSQNSAHCMTFWYHMSGAHVGTLKIKLRYQKPDEYDQVLWTLSGHQANCWKEGRVLLHKSVKHYQVVIEGEIGKGTGGIAVDDIKIDNHVAQEDCRKSTDVENEIDEEEDPESNQTGFTPPYHTGEDYDDNISRKPGNVLKTLDPILITIIAMSALGVLLGAICGVVLYCACWHNGMSERNLSALENYNFELVDEREDEKAGPSQGEDEEEEELINKMETTRSLSLSELRKDFSCHPGKHIVTWLLQCWDNGPSSLELEGKEAKQLGSLSKEGGIDKVIGKGAQALSLWRYPFKEDVIYRPGQWTTMEKGIQYLRELAMLEVIYGHLDNKQLSKDPD
ncbi:hypothetical protein QYF61_010405 [Mycteria americana]|uniref:MAM domain-containing protein n=1 Tax=Mycteria americana TaxID=33587 RepID=A0AAN7NIG7_MYCAM|nr:hypothetical protein QYF61_010405 [Mycteria americana]